MPLSEEAIWTYQAEPGLQNETVDLKVSGLVPIGSNEGYELKSGWGSSKLVWNGDQLFAAQLGGTEYNPPLPLLAKLRPEDEIKWTGEVTVAGISKPATASLKTKENEARIGSRTMTATESDITLTVGEDTHEIQTWFVENYGIARQEQRKNGLLINRLTYLSGP